MSLSILQAAQELGKAPFLVTPERSLSFAQVAERVSAAMDWLQAAGVEPGQTKPYALEVRLELRSIVVLLALFELGVPALLVHPRWTEIERARVLKSIDLAVQPLPDDFALFRGPGRAPAAATVPPSSPLAIVYTSGSSGTPRGVVLSRAAFVASAQAVAARLQWRDGDRWLLCLPLAHIGGLSILVRCLIARRPLVLEALYSPPTQFRGPEILRVIADCRVTVLSLVPTQLARLLESSLCCPPEVRAVILGGAGSPPSLLRRASHARWPVLCTYGLTEACSAVTLEPAPRGAPPWSSGLPLDGTEVRIHEGRIEVKSPTLFSEYYPELENPLSEDGWLRTQDCGLFDDQGCLQVLGRLDETIVSGGENVHPLEVEHVLMDYSAIAAVCVFGLPSDTWGQEVAAALVLRQGQSLGELRAHIAERLAPYKWPRRLALVEQLPTTASGKISRLRAQQLFAEQCVSWSELDL
jgi:o-succinylbenzoate---CoA ligase